MKTHRLLLPMLMGALAVLAALAALSRSQAVAEVPHEWIGRWYWKDGGWTDYAPSGVPDFDQKQDCWGAGGCVPPGAPPGKWTYCGPLAAANSLWWFDCKFERTPITPPIMNDSNYLVTSYSASEWDDHAPANVGGLTSPGFTGPPGLVDVLS